MLSSSSTDDASLTLDGDGTLYLTVGDRCRVLGQITDPGTFDRIPASLVAQWDALARWYAASTEEPGAYRATAEAAWRKAKGA